MLKSFCLIMSVVLCIVFIAKGMGHTAGSLWDAIQSHPTSKVFFFDNPMEGSYFWKQFIAGIFLAIAMTGLDQDMMQRTLACSDYRQSQKNMIVSSLMQVVVVGLFLILGTLLVMFVENTDGVEMPLKSDSLFSMVATHGSMPVVVGVLFILGLIAAAYSAAGSALTSLTTSYTVDIKGVRSFEESGSVALRRRVHVAMSVVMGGIIILFYYFSNSDAISAVYMLASYTYGPILGLFAFGMLCGTAVKDRFVPVVCIVSPILAWITQWVLFRTVGYQTGFELLLFNAAYVMIGLAICIEKKEVNNVDVAVE